LASKRDVAINSFLKKNQLKNATKPKSNSKCDEIFPKRKFFQILTILFKRKRDIATKYSLYFSVFLGA
jgi:hypothetical protein